MNRGPGRPWEQCEPFGPHTSTSQDNDPVLREVAAKANKGAKAKKLDLTPQAVYSSAEAKGLLKNRKTEDGFLPCYDYNRGSCKKGKGKGKGKSGADGVELCKYAHVCSVCGLKHPAVYCSEVRKAYKAASS